MHDGQPPGTLTTRAYRVAVGNGQMVHVEDYGWATSPRAPVLCLSGLTRSGRDFRDLACRLGRERRVVCLDYRGRGRSDYAEDWRDYAPERTLDDVLQVAAACRLHGVVAIGTSFGGILTMALAVARPTLLRAAILNDVGPELAADGSARILDYIGKNRPQPDLPAAIAEIQRLLPHASVTSPAGWETLARNTFRQEADGTWHFDWDTRLAQAFRRLGSQGERLWPMFRALRRLPVMVVRGARSDLLTAATMERMAQAHPGLHQVTVPDVGHAPGLDEPEVVAAMDRFLAPL